MKPRIVMMYCYLGKWPDYFRLFLKSCSYNRDIDFVFFSDCDPLSNTNYPNVKYVKISIDEFNAIASKKLGFPIAVPNAYKLCDFKPTYGLLFNEYIEKYDFWGFGDIDIVLGNVRRFITNEVLEAYDVIPVRKEYISGFFTLMRNTERINTLFQLSKDYQLVLQGKKNYCFDECNYAFDHLLRGGSILDVKTEIQSMTEIAVKEEQNGLRVHWKTIVEEDFGNHQWDKGTIKNVTTEKEMLLLHLINHKAHPFFQFPSWKKVPDLFYINFFGFYRSLNSWSFYLKDTFVKIKFLWRILNESFWIYFGPYFASRNKLTTHLLKSYVGEFQFGSSIITIDLVDDGLVCSGMGRKIRVTPLNKSLFIADNHPYFLEFSLDKKGMPKTLKAFAMPSIPSFSSNKIV